MSKQKAKFSIHELQFYMVEDRPARQEKIEDEEPLAGGRYLTLTERMQERSRLSTLKQNNNLF